MKPKREPTPEQKARAAERRKEFCDLWRQVKTITETGATVPEVPTVEGYALSLRNSIVCRLQRADVQLVGGFRQWLEYGRCVRKGEHGLAIWVPVGTGNHENAEPDPSAEPAEPNTPRRFVIGTVFDISQTVELDRTPKPEPAATV